MGHEHRGEAWRVRVDSADERPCGAGVLLDDRHVLTCAHVVRWAGGAPGRPGAAVSVGSLACRPGWRRTAHVAPGAWVQPDDPTTLRGDVTLLELDEPAGCGGGTTLWRTPVIGVPVRAYGFPDDPRYGVWVEARLVGSGGLEGEWVQMTPLAENAPWINRGCSGSGVVVEGGPFDGRVIGIVVAMGDDGAQVAWMMPTETIESYLRQVGAYADGAGANAFVGPRFWPADMLTGSPLRRTLTRELKQLLSGRWAGTVLVGTGTATTTAGESWLVRLVHTADPASRPVLDKEITTAPEGTVLGLGAIDAAFDARRRSVREVREYLARRFGLAADGGTDSLVTGLLRHRPPPCLVVGAVDRAADPGALVHELLGPLALRARGRGLRLVLGFEDRPPAGLPYEVYLDPSPLTGGSAEGDADAAGAAVEELAAAEDAAEQLRAREGMKFFGAPQLPPAAAPRLRVRLADARDAGDTFELAAVEAHAQDARAAVADFGPALQRMSAERDELRRVLELYRVRAGRLFGPEDRRLRDLYAAASRALLTPPVDLPAARRAVERYGDAVEGEE